MLAMLLRWYRQRFSDPQAVSLALLLLIGAGTLYFFSSLITPLLAAIVLAYLLEWPVGRLTHYGMPRTLSVVLVMSAFVGLMLLSVLVLVPSLWQQCANLARDIPTMLNQFHNFVASLPEHYPDYIDYSMLDTLTSSLRDKFLAMGESVLKLSLASLVSLVALAVYLVLVPLMVFFLLKDKQQMFRAVSRVLPKNRHLVGKVWLEMNQQITNYIRGKVIEILVVGVTSYLTFIAFGLNYPLLLAVLVGLSVLIPYIGAALVTIPVALVALFQWGISPEFWYLLTAYLIIQALDGNLLVPVLFSEAVNLHPLVIIVSVLVFGGLWGFWGVFFAIPLATLVK
ncbi:MAG: AI-2E family transporter, partial [Plesiomonas shigelloides]